MGIVGAELASLARLEAAVNRHGAVLEQLRAALGAEIAATDWQGHAAERFRGAWRDDHEPALRRLEMALREAAAEVSRRRVALEAAGS
ncbi:MAG TPA: hypothetical protein VMZ22_08490 [Acidimicrobiales bacterium]|nr:hypothetical protein [Acidimicrobiales bacterium]